jgi:hypothetical protein
MLATYERLEDTTGLFVDHSGDTLDTTTTSETTNRRLGNTLNIVAKNLHVVRYVLASGDELVSYLAVALCTS